MIITTRPDRSSARRIRTEQWWLAGAVALLALLQLLALGDRNPLTRTLSSYEYTAWGWLFPASLAVFGIGIAVLALRWRRARRGVRASLAGAAAASWATAAFPSGDVLAGSYWPGEVHRWASIALMVLVLVAALLARRDPSMPGARGALSRLILVGGAAGVAFLLGQTLKPEVVTQIGLAPLAGGLTQRILVAAVAAVLLLFAARRPAEHRSGGRPPRLRVTVPAG